MKNCSGWMGTGVGTVGMSSGRYGHTNAQFMANPHNDARLLELAGEVAVVSGE
jgi:hypothetical protein